MDAFRLKPSGQTYHKQEACLDLPVQQHPPALNPQHPTNADKMGPPNHVLEFYGTGSPEKPKVHLDSFWYTAQETLRP